MLAVPIYRRSGHPSPATPLQSWKLCIAVKPSPLHGVGVFALRDIPAGTNPLLRDDDAVSEWVDAKRWQRCTQT